MGRRALPYLVLFQIALPLFAPLIDLFSIYGILFLDPWTILGFWITFTGLQLLLGCTRSGSTVNRRACCGRCRSSSSSTGS